MKRAMTAALVALSACAPAHDGKEQAAAPTALAPPTPGDIGVRIKAEQNGATVDVSVNQRFAIELVGVPTAGYLWTPAQLPGFVQRAGEASGDTVREQSQPGFAGGSHWEVLMFAATAAGEGEIVLEQRRPWETSEPPAQVFRVTIRAR